MTLYIVSNEERRTSYDSSSLAIKRARFPLQSLRIQAHPFPIIIFQLTLLKQFRYIIRSKAGPFSPKTLLQQLFLNYLSAIFKLSFSNLLAELPSSMSTEGPRLALIDKDALILVSRDGNGGRLNWYDKTESNIGISDLRKSVAFGFINSKFALVFQVSGVGINKANINVAEHLLYMLQKCLEDECILDSSDEDEEGGQVPACEQDSSLRAFLIHQSMSANESDVDGQLILDSDTAYWILVNNLRSGLHRIMGDPETLIEGAFPIPLDQDPAIQNPPTETPPTHTPQAQTPPTQTAATQDPPMPTPATGKFEFLIQRSDDWTVYMQGHKIFQVPLHRA